jgi:hypothetical protein
LVAAGASGDITERDRGDNQKSHNWQRHNISEEPVMKTITKSWRDVLPIHPAANLFPLMSPDELRALGEDIKKNGLKIPVTVWKEQKDFEPQLLDGRNRLDAMEAVGLPICVENAGTELDPAIKLWNDAWPIEVTEVRGDKPGGDPFALVVSANIHRRHLTHDQKTELVAKLLKAKPEKSNRQIAKAAKVDDKTVASIRDELEAGAEIPHLKETTGADGKSYPAKKKPARRKRKPAASARPASPPPTAAITKANELVDDIGIDVVKRLLAALDEPFVWDALRDVVRRWTMNGAAAGLNENTEDHWIESDTL